MPTLEALPVCGGPIQDPVRTEAVAFMFVWEYLAQKKTPTPSDHHGAQCIFHERGTSVLNPTGRESV